jgi:amino acid transporter
MSTTRQPEGTAKGAHASVFAREATGLVREVSPLNASILGASSGPLGEFVVFSIPFGFGLFAATHEWAFLVASVIAALFSIPILLNYSVLAAAMPRSGGDYVYTSRIVRPDVGFASNFSVAVWQIVGAGAFAALAVTTMLSPAFTILGSLLGSTTLTNWGGDITSSGWVIVLGGLLLVAISVVLIFGTQRALRINTIVWFVGMAAMTLLVFALLFTSHSHFVNAFNDAVGKPTAYRDVIASAHKAGMSFRGSWAMVWPLIGVAMAVFGWYFWSAYIGGEVRQARSFRRELNVMFWPLAITLAYVLAIIAVMSKTFGYEFISSVAYLGFVNPSALTSPVAAGAPVYLTGLAMGSNVLATLFVIGFVAWAWPLITIFLIMPVRSALAWSLDQIFPNAITEVSRRWHTPVRATLLAMAIAIGIVIYSTKSDQVAQIFAVEIMATAIFSQGMTGVTAALFPRRMPELYRAQPIARRHPTLVISGVVAVAFTLFWSAAYIKYSSEFGFKRWLGVLFVAIFVLGFVIYHVMRTVRERRGIPISLAFEEIPPE